MDKSSLQTTLWAATAIAPSPTFPLHGETTAEVAIIGGGFTGCSAALHLANRGVDTVVVEAEEVGHGGSGRNLGLVSAGLWLDPEEILRRLEEPFGERLLKELGETPNLVRSLVGRYNIDCDLVEKAVIKGAHSRRAMNDVCNHVRQWRDRGASVQLLGKHEIVQMTGSRRYVGGLVDHRTFTVQPLSYARGLASAAIQGGARIYTRTEVTELTRAGGDWRVRTAGGVIRANKVIVCTGAYGTNFLPGLRESFAPVGCFIFATAPITPDVRPEILPGGAALYDTQPAMLFARFDRHHRLLVGSLGWLPFRNSGHGWARRALRELFPQLRDVAFEFGWAGNLDFTDNHLPWLAKPEDGLYLVGGYNGRGIGPGTYWGKILADWVCGEEEKQLALPVTRIPVFRNRALKTLLYSLAFRSHRMKNRLRLH